MQTTFDAIVIGAGPAGSTAAIRLAQAGWSVALIEKQRFPRRKVCGECVSASNLPLLEALGVVPSFSALAGPVLKRVVLMLGEAAVCADLPAYADDRYPWGRALGREHLDALLLERANEAGATLLQPWAVRAVRGQAGRYECAVQDLDAKTQRSLHARVVIDAHGSWEPGLADAHAGQGKPGESDLFAFKANFAHAALEPGVLPVLAFRGGYGGMVQADRELLTLACCIRRDRLSACRKHVPGQAAGEAVQAYLQRECRGVREALVNATRVGKWLSVGPIHPGVRMPRGGGRFFLVGNAAGEAHPIIGEGMSMAMQAAWLACDRLLSEPGILSDARLQVQALKDYAKAWHAHFARRLHVAAGCAHLAMRPAAAHLLMPALLRWPGAVTRAACWSGKVSAPGILLPRQIAHHTDGAANRFHEISDGENA